MPLIGLKNTRGNGPRGVIDVKSVQHTIPVGGEETDIDVDDHTAEWLAEVWENNGDLEVIGGAPARSSKNKEHAKEHQPEGRAKL